MAKRSVLMVVAKYPATHGHTTVIDNLCAGLNKMGYRAAIGAFSFEKDPPFDIGKISLSKSRLLTSGVKYLDFDIIHSHQSRVNYYLLSIKPTKPIVLHYHGAANKIQELNFKFSMRLYKNRISKIISVSNAGTSQITKLIGSVNATVIYNGVDIDFYKPDLPQPYKKGNPQLLFVSALREYKKTPLLVESMPEILQKYPDAHLQIVGDGEDFLRLKELIKKKNLESKVELTGKINDEELRLRYSSCDLYLSASTFEVCPVPTLEAMACGKPLVLYDIESHKEMVDVSKAGMVFSLIGNSTIANKIDEVYKNKITFGHAARKFAENHDWSSVCKQISEIYDQI